jgi:hypothetical protein
VAVGLSHAHLSRHGVAGEHPVEQLDHRAAQLEDPGSIIAFPDETFGLRYLLHELGDPCWNRCIIGYVRRMHVEDASRPVLLVAGIVWLAETNDCCSCECRVDTPERSTLLPPPDAESEHGTKKTDFLFSSLFYTHRNHIWRHILVP